MIKSKTNIQCWIKKSYPIKHRPIVPSITKNYKIVGPLWDKRSKLKTCSNISNFVSCKIFSPGVPTHQSIDKADYNESHRVNLGYKIRPKYLLPNVVNTLLHGSWANNQHIQWIQYNQDHTVSKSTILRLGLCHFQFYSSRRLETWSVQRYIWHSITNFFLNVTWPSLNFTTYFVLYQRKANFIVLYHCVVIARSIY